MKPRIAPLPHWVLTDLQPAFYDTEAGSVLELLSKIYGKIEELINDYNLFANEVNSHLDAQDKEIADSVQYMKDNLTDTVNELFEQGLEDGTFTSTFNITYDSETETLTINNELTSVES